MILASVMQFFSTVASGGMQETAVIDGVFLQQLQKSADTEVRIELVRTLQQTAPANLRVTLEAIALNSKEESRVRMEAMCALSGVATKDSIPLLLDLLEDDLKLRRGYWACLIPVLGGVNDRRSIPLLTRIINLDQAGLIGMDHMAIEALASIGDEREALILAGKGHIEPVRLAVIKGVARIASIKSVNVFINALQGAEDAEIASAAMVGLHRLGQGALPELEKALQGVAEGWDKLQRERIRQVILKIGK